MQKGSRKLDVEVETHSRLRYPHRLSLYDRPPTEDITIEEFETCAINRLHVLAEIESCYARNRPFDELREITNLQCEKHVPLDHNSAITKDRDSQRRKDITGHFVLRLAFCQTEELRRRFVKAETTLFRVRYLNATISERKGFHESKDFDWIQANDDIKATHELQLKAVVPDADERNSIPQVRWTRVPDLVEKRRVFLKDGWAYVPSREQSSIVFQEFQTRLEQALEMTAKALPRMDEDTRLEPILANLSQGSLLDEGTAEGVRAEMHFPMCMRNLHENLKRTHHLKHFGRLQYGLFLKVLGLPIEEALIFWRKSFSGHTDDQFIKRYKYNIRHSYGLEGRRANYPAKSCQQILMNDQPGPTDSHGCPYRHFSHDNLQMALLSMYSSQGLTEADLPEIMHTVRTEAYHVACTRVYEITHATQNVRKGNGIGSGETVTHPNQYAEASRALECASTSTTTNSIKMEVDGGDIVML
ncbi:DNA primase large subunit [Multifurca ochricompacta]|uniref:DNA primase large subunit n=1 Tax=Multifurca ochricompacta TaxID=376703 RepID=A0AAD4M9Y9_9AGAM|nr:DNA primase large subunit [Multifurca ochricompacta]